MSFMTLIIVCGMINCTWQKYVDVHEYMMYMSDFWGGLKLPDEKHNPIEKLHYMFCKQLLGGSKANY